MANKDSGSISTGKGIFNAYTIKPKSLTQYTAFRGVTDFTQIGQFQQYEKGFQFLQVINRPKFLSMLAKKATTDTIKNMNISFEHMLEYEFRGLDGLPDIQADTLELTDGINTQRMVSKVTQETSATISMQYFERSGGLIEKYSEYYLTGLHDLKTQAKTYHGLIQSGDLSPSYANEVWTMMYYVTDSTMLRLERAVLLANCQLTKADFSQYNGNRDAIGQNVEYTLEFNCMPITGYYVDRAANYLLGHDITGYHYLNSSKNSAANKIAKMSKTADNLTFSASSVDYKYKVLKSESSNTGATDLKTAYTNASNM